MRSRFRVRRVAKWAGVLSTLVLLGLWVASVRYRVMFNATNRTWIMVAWGQVAFDYYSGPPDELEGLRASFSSSFPRGWRVLKTPTGEMFQSPAAWGLKLPIIDSSIVGGRFRNVQ